MSGLTGDDAEAEYDTNQRETLAEVPGLRVRLLAVDPGTAHEVTPATAGGSCRFMIVQGVGTYDYVPLPADP